MAVPSTSQLDLEFAYTSWENSCKNLYDLDGRCCRRPVSHDDGIHASGYGTGRLTWRDDDLDSAPESC